MKPALAHSSLMLAILISALNFSQEDPKVRIKELVVDGTKTEFSIDLGSISEEQLFKAEFIIRNGLMENIRLFEVENPTPSRVKVEEVEGSLQQGKTLCFPFELISPAGKLRQVVKVFAELEEETVEISINIEVNVVSPVSAPHFVRFRRNDPNEQLWVEVKPQLPTITINEKNFSLQSDTLEIASVEPNEDSGFRLALKRKEGAMLPNRDFKARLAATYNVQGGEQDIVVDKVLKVILAQQIKLSPSTIILRASEGFLAGEGMVYDTRNASVEEKGRFRFELVAVRRQGLERLSTELADVQAELVSEESCLYRYRFSVSEEDYRDLEMHDEVLGIAIEFVDLKYYPIDRGVPRFSVEVGD